MPVEAFAENYPAPGTVFDYEITSTEVNGLSTGQGVATLAIQEGPEGAVAVTNCTSRVSCRITIQRDFVKGVLRAQSDADRINAMTVADWHTLPSAITIALEDETGGAFFPLEAGKVLRWSEIWRSAHVAARYEMAVTQRCCVAAGHPMAKSDTLWSIEHSFERVDGQTLSEGTVSYLYDPTLGWYLQAETTTRTQTAPNGPVQTRIIRSDLKGLRDLSELSSPDARRN